MAEAPVSRETPPPPEGLSEAFGAAWPRVLAYARLLAGAGVQRGLLGPREVERLWERHLGNCLQVSTAVPERADVCDLGSGAGLPGVVLALARPDVRVTLLEPLLRRTRFLDQVVDELPLANARVVRARAEDHRGRYDVVTARAVAPLDRLAGWALPLCRPGGLVLALKGASVEEEVRAAEPTLHRHAARSWRIRELQLSTATERVLAVEIVAGETGGAARPTTSRRS